MREERKNFFYRTFFFASARGHIRFGWNLIIFGWKSLKKCPMSSDSYVESLAVLDTLINDVELGKAQLLDGRGNVNWVDQRFGNSMLHVLAFRDLCDQLKLLIAFGADVNVRNKVRTSHCLYSKIS